MRVFIRKYLTEIKAVFRKLEMQSGFFNPFSCKMIQSDTVFRKIIIVCNDLSACDCMVKHFELQDYEIRSVNTAIDFYKAIDRERYALAIIDIDLPDQSGLVLSKYLRTNTNTLIILLTENVSIESRIEAYESGADQLIGIPVNLKELSVVIANFMTRIAKHESGSTDSKLRVTGSTWQLNPEEWSLLTPSGKHLRLTAKEYTFLNCFVSVQQGIVSRSSLLQNLGYTQNEYGHRSLESLVYRLRKKISPNLDTPIKTANGSGYAFSSVLELNS